MDNKRFIFLAGLVALAFVPSQRADADSVAQVQTAKRIAETTVQLIDPQGGGTTGGAGGNVNYAVGDILTFNIRFTPVENGATRGLGGYITEYIPGNTEVVGARFVNTVGETVCPHRGGFGPVGFGARGAANYAAGDFPTSPDPGFLEGEGGISSLYADTGIFFSSDSRTARAPTADFTTVSNGVTMSCDPTGVGQLEDLIGAANNPNGDHFAHNEWDNTQLQAFGCNSSFNRGSGNTPFGYGSAVAGPDTFYKYEATDNGGVIETAGVVGPWQRVKTPCAEIGTGVPATVEGPIADRLGVPTSLGFQLSADTPLPASTNAVRFAVGELAVGEEYQVEISLRVLAAPLDPLQNADTNCSEVFGGDASARALDGSSGGKDNTWRYFLPAPACVDLGLLFNLDSDKLQVLAGDTITYTVRTKNLDATTTHTNVVITDDLLAGVGDVTFVSADNGGTQAGGLVTWPAITLAPGDEVIYTVVVTAAGNNSPILNRSTYVSDQLPVPGFSVVSLTNLGPIAVPSLNMSVSPAAVAAGDTVTYTASVANNGSGDARLNCADCGYTVTLPPGVTVVPGTVTVDAAAAGDPSFTGQVFFFDSGVFAGSDTISPGASKVLSFDALVGVGVTPGVYGSKLDTWIDDPAQREMSDSINNVARIFVDITQSDTPVINAPIFQDAIQVCGTSTEADGTAITVSVDLLATATDTVTANAWCVVVPSLIAGQNIAATATNSGASEVESQPSAVVIVEGTAGVVVACNDGVDNDGDGLIDLADPGCVDATDLDETDDTQCSNGVDDDGNGETDFPNDIGCSSYADNDESGIAACADSIDNDGDGATDLADPGCDDAADTSEADIPLCSNGIDDDGDTLIDYPEDTGCDSAVDDDEASGNIVPPDAGPIPDAGAAADGDAGAAADAGVAPDPGGVKEPNSGCGCSTGTHASSNWLWLLACILFLRRRRRRAS
tara:strand:- start:42316 stop:45180 length:2865 start_codon:yes stop_codon:yes gene_type:complete